MKQISTILEKLEAQERELLRQDMLEKNTAPSRYLLALLDDAECTAQDFRLREKMSIGSLHKTVSTAFEVLSVWISEKVAMNLSPASDMLWWFCSKGLYAEGWKYYLRCEKKLQSAKDYAALQSLYTEAMRLQIYIGNLVAMEELRELAVLNAARLAEYTAVQTAYSIEIVRLENPRLQTSLAYEEKLRALVKQAQRAEHHNLVSNALYCLFVYHTRHAFSVEKTMDVVEEMKKTLRRYAPVLSPYRKAVLANNIAQFTLLYDVPQRPEEFVEIVERGLPNEWQNIGKIGVCGYYIATRQLDKAKRLRSTIDMSNIAIEKELASVAKLDLSLAWEDFKTRKLGVAEFRLALQHFYDLPGRRVYRELDFMARTLEILFLLRLQAFDTAVSKCEALRKFCERGNTNEFQAFDALVQPYLTTAHALSQGKQPKLRSIKKHTARWTRWALEELENVVNDLAKS